MSARPIYDETGGALRLSYALLESGCRILAADPQDDDARRALVLGEIAAVKKAIGEAATSVTASGGPLNWTVHPVAESLLVAIHDANAYAFDLRQFVEPMMPAEDGDGTFDAGSLCDIAFEVVYRDHAERVQKHLAGG